MTQIMFESFLFTRTTFDPFLL